jgi:hypothetical protein
MKALLISTLLVILLASNSFGQGEGKLSVGVGSSMRNGLTADLYIDRNLGERWQIGLMPSALFAFNPQVDYTLITLNLNTRFYLSKWRVIRPYTYAYTGYGEEYSKFVDSPDPTSVVKFINNSLGVGVRIAIGKKGWSLDGNIGYLGYIGTSEKNYFQTVVYSFSIFKSFGKKEKR